MRIGIVADTHDNLFTIRKAVKIFNEEGAELLLHAGDHVAPFSVVPLKEAGCRLIGVYGNNDGEQAGLLKSYAAFGELHKAPYYFKVNDYRIVLMHEPFAIEELFECGKFDLIVYGHSHVRDIRKKKGALLVNPGECCGYLGEEPSVVLVDSLSQEIKVLRII